MIPPQFPAFVKNLPEADLPLDGLRGWLLQSESGQLMFMEADKDIDMPLHSHGDQWGFVVDGRIELTIGEETRTRTRGDSYVIPAGTMHGGKIRKGFRAVDFFTDPDRYHPRS